MIRLSVKMRVSKAGIAKFRAQGKAKLVAELARKYAVTEKQVLDYIQAVADAEEAVK